MQAGSREQTSAHDALLHVQRRLIEQHEAFDRIARDWHTRFERLSALEAEGLRAREEQARELEGLRMELVRRENELMARIERRVGVEGAQRLAFEHALTADNKARADEFGRRLEAVVADVEARLQAIHTEVDETARRALAREERWTADLAALKALITRRTSNVQALEVEVGAVQDKLVRHVSALEDVRSKTRRALLIAVTAFMLGAAALAFLYYVQQ